jgi:hypothetical protein
VARSSSRATTHGFEKKASSNVRGPRNESFRGILLDNGSSDRKIAGMDSVVSTLIRAWHWSYVDVDMAFEGLSPEVLHRRPNDRIASIAEIVAHTAYSEASIVLRYLLGVPKADWPDHVMLRDPYGWPPRILAELPKRELVAMTPEEVMASWLQHHDYFLSAMADFSVPHDHRFTDEWSEAAPDVETRLRFAAYHVGYHVAQIYSNRHFFGDDTPDN